MRLFTALVLTISHSIGAVVAHANDIVPVVEAEEVVYEFTPANNGAGPMWCHGSTSIVRAGDRVFATGLETLDDVAPLNNCRWFLMERTKEGWQKIYTDPKRTREPSPIAAFMHGPLFVSANPTSVTDPAQYAGPSKPEIVQFDPSGPTNPVTVLRPDWSGEPSFTEHSYRSFAADRAARELIVFQNIDYTHAEWSFLDRTGQWSARGKLDWPQGDGYVTAQPIRICYPNVALRDRAVYFCGVSDILEPNPEWRDFKRELTGQQWDYDFRRLFFTWAPDIANTGFNEWIEISSREKTAGWITPGDLWVAPNDDVHLLWNERALDERLREKFFPEEKQSHGLYHAVVRDGKVVHRRALVLAEEGGAQDIPGRGRFHITEGGDLLVVCAVNRTTDTGRVQENWLLRIDEGFQVGEPITLPLKRPFTDFFTTTIRAGSPRSNVIELLGRQAGRGNVMSYARIRVE